MGTEADCQAGHHTSDNQGLCWWCGCVVNPDWLEEYYGTAKVLNSSNASNRSANVERAPSVRVAKAAANQAFSSRVRITIVSYRQRLTDSDGVSGKAAIDGLVQAGILQDDSPEFVEEVVFRQVKVPKEFEETQIIIEEVT